MSMSMYIVGFTPPDERWLKMKSVYDACKEANVAIPEDVMEFFDYLAPNENGVQVNLNKIATEYNYEDAEGLEIEVDNIPSNIKTIRFYVSF